MTYQVSRVSRGGSWYYPPLSARVAFRFKYSPDFRNFNLGLRLARSLLQRMAR